MYLFRCWSQFSVRNTKIYKTLQRYIFHILQHFATKFCHFTNFKMFFLAVVMNSTNMHPCIRISQRQFRATSFAEVKFNFCCLPTQFQNKQPLSLWPNLGKPFSEFYQTYQRSSIRESCIVVVRSSHLCRKMVEADLLSSFFLFFSEYVVVLGNTVFLEKKTKVIGKIGCTEKNFNKSVRQWDK